MGGLLRKLRKKTGQSRERRHQRDREGSGEQISQTRRKRRVYTRNVNGEVGLEAQDQTVAANVPGRLKK